MILLGGEGSGSKSDAIDAHERLPHGGGSSAAHTTLQSGLTGTGWRFVSRNRRSGHVYPPLFPMQKAAVPVSHSWVRRRNSEHREGSGLRDKERRKEKEKVRLAVHLSR